MESNNMIFTQRKGNNALIETFVKSDNGKKIILFRKHTLHLRRYKLLQF